MSMFIKVINAAFVHALIEGIIRFVGVVADIVQYMQFTLNWNHLLIAILSTLY